MSAPTELPLGLRERKKRKLRRTIQTEALRLFETRGYEQTTVEQIAEAAETSTTTFYRYFPTKEDVVLDDEYDPLIAAAIGARPVDEPLAITFRVALATVVAAAEADRDHNLARLRLITTVPSLTARYAGEERRNIDLVARVLARRTGREVDDYQLNLVAAALVAVLFTATHRWGAERGATPLGTLLDAAITIVEPVLSALDRTGLRPPPPEH